MRGEERAALATPPDFSMLSQLTFLRDDDFCGMMTVQQIVYLRMGKVEIKD
jgi:hypothetical protein